LEDNTIMEIAAVIPCYNEEKAIAGIVARANKYVSVVIVADDWSLDETLERAEGVGAYSTLNEKNRKGAGGNTAHGIRIARQLDKADIVVTLDGDGQNNPDEIPQVLKPILKGKADFVIGSRFLGNCTFPKYRKFGIEVITKLINIGHSKKITDGQSCFRAYSKYALESILPIEEKGFAFSVETLIKARKKGLRMVEVPISCVYHDDFRQNSSMNPLSHGLSVVFGVIKWRLIVER